MSKATTTKQLTILHSNDIHGDFMAELEKGTGKLVGGFVTNSCNLLCISKL